MKWLFFSILMVAWAVYAWAATPVYQQASTLQQDGNGNAVAAIQEFSPNGKFDALLTVTKQTVFDMRDFVKWSIYSPACKFRNMSTMTKAGGWRTVPATTYIIRGVHPATPFLNFTGCTAGELQRQ